MSRLGAVYQRRGSSREAAAVLDLSVMLARRLDEHGLLAEALLEQGRGFLSRGDFDSATKSLDEALGESRLAGDVRQEGRSLYYRGVVFRDQNRYDDALRCYQEATIRFQAAKDDRLLTFPLYDMGIVLQYTGATVESRRRFEEVIQVYERIGYRSGTAAAVLNVGVLEDRKGDFESAQNCFRRSREIADAIGEKLASGYAVFSMGATYYKMHDYRKALYYLKQSYNLFKGLEARGYYGYPLSYLTCVYADTEAVDSAVRACFLHLKNEKEIGTDVENGRAYLGLATALTKNKPASRTAGDLLGRIARYQKLGESTPDAYFLLAISKASANGYVNTLIPTHHQYGHYLMTRKRDQEANVHLEKAYRLAVDSKWERFVAAFERDHRALVATFAKESGNSKAPQPAGRG
jgi:tetratricopeptide (TPR) repeat protein